MKFDHLFGPAEAIRLALERKMSAPQFEHSGPHKFLFYGPAGIGKSQVAKFISSILDKGRFSTIEINGKELTVDEVRHWRKTMKTRPLGSSHWVTIIDELDRSSRDAQDLMLSWLDQMPPFGVVIGTSNLELDSLQERLHTRFQQVQFEAPSDQDIHDALVAKNIPKDVALRITEGAKGNVRAAELDATSWEDFSKPNSTSDPK